MLATFVQTILAFRRSLRKHKMDEMDEAERARRKELKELYVDHRDTFRNNEKAMEELEAWRERKIDYDYTVM